MKKLLLSLTALVFVVISGYAQSFYSGFDTPANQNQWTKYRLGSVTSYNWTYVSSTSVSAPYSVYHDYPMSGLVEDWLVSPKLYFTGSTSSISLYSKRFAYSSPPEVYYGIWISYSSKNPASGGYSELADFTGFPVVQSTWNDTVLNFSLQADSGYIAIKYKVNDYAWYMLNIDNITIDSASTSPLTNVQRINIAGNVKIYPNPADKNIFIETPGNKNSTVELVNIEGQILRSFTLQTSEAGINIGNLDAGLYILKIYTANEVVTEKIIIQ